MFEDLLGAQASAISGLRCQQHVAALSQIHRIIGTPGYTQAIDYIRAELAALGLVDVSNAHLPGGADVTNTHLPGGAGDGKVQSERFPMDGAYAYGDWIAPVGWTPRRAELWVESPQRFRLCDFAETPVSLHVGSQSTPPGGLRGQLVDIGDGLSEESYGQRDLRGALALTSGNVREVYEEAVRRRGVIGLVSDNMPWQAPGIGRSPLDQPDLVSYNKLAVRRAEIGSGVFSFGISARQGAHLRQLMQAGPVHLHALVEADVHPGEIEVLSATIPAAQPDAPELLLLSHLCHPQPGANDNATGPALLLELARVLLADTHMARHCQIRFLFVPEVYGTIAWLLESQMPRSKPRLVINLDMVGGDSAQTRGHLWLDRTPWSVPTYANDLIAALLAGVEAQSPDGWRYGVREHMGGSDHILFLAPEIAAPAVMLGHEPDRFYHSNQDTLDKTSPREFEKVGQVVLATLRALQNWNPADVRRLAYLVYSQAARRIMAYVGEILQHGAAHADQELAYASRLALLLRTEQVALQAIVEDAPDVVKETAQIETARLAQKLAALVAEQRALLAQTVGPAQPRTRDAAEAKRAAQIPQKRFGGPISSHLMGLSRFYAALGDGADFYRARSQEDRTFVRWMFEAVNLMDGRHTLGEIADLLQAEFGFEFVDGLARWDDLQRLVDDLVAAEMVALSAVALSEAADGNTPCNPVIDRGHGKGTE